MRLVDRFLLLLGYLGALGILSTLVIEVFVIVGRQIGWSLAGSDAYAGYTLAAGSFLALGYTLRRGEHIRVTLLLQRLKPRARWWMEVLGLAVATWLAAAFAYFGARLVWGSYAFHDVSQNVDATPLWIPQLAMAIGLVGLALAFAAQLVLTLRTGQVQAPAAETLSE